MVRVIFSIVQPPLWRAVVRHQFGFGREPDSLDDIGHVANTDNVFDTKVVAVDAY